MGALLSALQRVGCCVIVSLTVVYLVCETESLTDIQAVGVSVRASIAKCILSIYITLSRSEIRNC
jgi:hypothetical protein